MNSEQSSSTGFWRPFFICIGVFPTYFLGGATLGQSAGMLPQLLDKGSSIPIDNDQSTWIGMYWYIGYKFKKYYEQVKLAVFALYVFTASAVAIGTFAAAYISGTLADVFGRIRVIQASYLFFGTGFAMIVGANGFYLLFVGRFLIGVGTGCCMSGQVFVSEIAPAAWRGVFLSSGPFMSSVGIIYMYIVGGYFPWIIGACTSFLISILGLIISLFLYDSPVWLIKNNKIETARKSLTRIEGSKHVDARLKEIQDIADNQPKIKLSLKDLTEPTVWKPFAMICVMSVLQNTSGFYIVISYTVQLMQEFHSQIDPLHITIAVGVARMLSMGITTFLHGIIGRRSVGALSGFSCAFMLLLIYVYLKIEGGIPFLRENSWIPITLFLLYVMAMSLGILPLPWAYPYEVFPIRVRGMMCGLSTSIMFLVMSAAVKLYYGLMDNFKLEGVILLFCISSLIFGLFSVTILVETHDKTLNQVEEMFLGGKQKREKKSENHELSESKTVSEVFPTGEVSKSTRKDSHTAII